MHNKDPDALPLLCEVGHHSTYSTQVEAALANVNDNPLKKGVIFYGLILMHMKYGKTGYSAAMC